MKDVTLLEAHSLLMQSQSIVLTTHFMPDGDGLGAELALYSYLKRLGKEVQIRNPDSIPQRYQFLNREKVIRTHTDEVLDSVDLAVIVDTNDPKRIGKLWDQFLVRAKNILIFDHHPYLHESSDDQSALKNVSIVLDVKSSSIGELLYRLFRQDLSFQLTPEVALGLYVSIITDTNSFRYSRTTALSHRIAAELIDFGIEPEEIYRNIYSTKSIEHLRLIGEVLSKVQQSGLIAWVEITKQLRDLYQATSDDTQSIVNFLLLIQTAEVLVLLREEDNYRIKVSLKSKGKIPVRAVAQEFGGGGHEYASGFTTTLGFGPLREQLIQRLLEISQ